MEPREPLPIRLLLTQEERQMVLLALAELSLARPGWDDTLNRIAKRIDRIQTGRAGSRAEMYDNFRRLGGGGAVMAQPSEQ